MTATPMISWPRIQYGLRLLSALRRAVRVLGSGSVAKIMVGLGPRGVRQNPTIAVATRRSLAPAPGPMSTVKFARACTTWPKSERYEPNRRQDHPLTNAYPESHRLGTWLASMDARSSALRPAVDKIRWIIAFLPAPYA